MVFPVVNLQQLSSQLGFAGDVEFTEQTKAIRLFVNEINAHGGINGRKLNAIIANFDPTNEASMRALCKDWTEGSPAAFAVVDGASAWTGADQLCITQEGQTPFIGAWTTVTNWTQMGSPYLWWTGPDQAVVLNTTVQWGQSAGLLGGSRKVGVIAGDRASDQLALNQYLLPDLRNIGVTPVVETIAADIADTATTSAEAPLAIQKLRSAGVQSVIPLVPFNVFFPLLQAETQQMYFPKLLLSDYEGSIESGLGLIPVPYEQALNGQQGITTETLGGFDDARPESPRRIRPGGAQLLHDVAQDVPEAPEGQRVLLHRGARPDRRLVPGGPPVRAGGHDGRRQPQPPNVRRGDVSDHQLPGDTVADAFVRTEQVRRAHPVPGGQPAQQRATVLAVQVEDQPQTPGHLLGGATELASAGDRGGRVAGRPGRPARVGYCSGRAGPNGRSPRSVTRCANRGVCP